MSARWTLAELALRDDNDALSADSRSSSRREYSQFFVFNQPRSPGR
jgi:hypothetical protein